MLKFLTPRWVDIIDIIIVAVIIYYFLKLIKGTKALSIIIGLGIILLISFIANLLDMRTLSMIMDSIKAIWVIAFIVIFQPEIRNILMKIGKYKIIKPKKVNIVDEIIKGVELLKERRLGAIIVIEREVGLKDYIETGVIVDSSVSGALIATIFTPPAPLHDGACIIRGDKIIAAGCILPLGDIEKAEYLGLRHRAGIGITSMSDSVAVVVSEETGKISYSVDGRLDRGLTPVELKRNLKIAISRR